MKPRRIINLMHAVFWVSLFFASNSLSYAAKDIAQKKQPVEAEAKIDKSLIQIGDKFTYSILVKAKNNIEVEFPQMLPENLTDFAIKDFGSSQKSLFGKRTFKQWYLLDTYVSGEHTIPAAVIKYRTKGAKDWQETSVKELKVTVKSVLAAASARKDIMDIKGPKGFPGKMWIYVLVALVIILIAGTAFSLFLFKKKKEQHKAPPSAHIVAYEALAALERKDYISKGQIKAYYIELSDIVRHYLENRFNIRAPEMTSEEFLFKVKEDSTLSLEHKGLLREFLLNCDLVKFAKYQPAEKEAKLSLDSAKKLIDQTKEENAEAISTK